MPISGGVSSSVVLCRIQRWFLTSNILISAVLCVGKRWGLKRSKAIGFQNRFSPQFKGDVLSFSCIYRL